MDAAEEFVDDILAHHGVKGMKWGVRRKTPLPRSVRTKVKPRKHMKTKVKTRGGRAQPATPEAIEARTAQQVLKKSGVNALSNKDLQMLQTRLNLEQNVSRLSKRRVRNGETFVRDQLKKGGKKAVKGAKVVGAAAVAA